MGQGYLIDTNVILDFMGGKLPANSTFFLSQIIDNQINISAINKIELLGFFDVEQMMLLSPQLPLLMTSHLFLIISRIFKG